MASRTYVCESCIEDPDLQEVVRKNVISEECDYCGRCEEQPIACELSDVLERIRFVVGQYYTDPANFVYWDGREGGWQGHPVHDAWDLFENIGLGLANEDLTEDIINSFSDEEFADEYFWPGSPHERQLSSWQRFKQIVKHKRRFTFWNVEDDPELGIAEWQPKELLASIGEAIRALPLAAKIPVGQVFWRVRVHSLRDSLNRASDFTSPPIKKAVFPNRMSPSGIPMFYGSDDFATAVLETVDPTNVKRKKASGFAFRNVVPLNLLDLTAVPAKIGFFSDRTREVREAVEFFRAFTKDITRPVKKDGTQHTEYVPTQVFTEYIRYELKTPANEPFHGIKYPSSKNGRGCYVLFVEQDECLSTRKPRSRPQVLSVVRGSHTTKVLHTKRKPK